MCGICGFTGDVDKELIRSMTSILEHRGPDQNGIFTSDKINLGHRRLSIIDLSSAGKQPMSNEDDSIWITYNGEIYNFKELKEVLQSKGHKFKSNTDTEVIIHGYEEWGDDVVNKLNGMFAFAIWDETNKSLFLARDRVGIKPLYYALVQGSLIFASEMKSILLHPLIKKNIDKNSLSDYLSYRYVPEPRTIIEGINKLPPSHYLVFNNGKLSITRYWSLVFDSDNKDFIEYKEELKDTLIGSVKQRLLGDVPMGVFLSGGLDSSGIVAIMDHLKVNRIRTFSIGYEVKEEDEVKEAKFVSDYFNTDHHEVIIGPNPIDILPKLLWHLDEPIADPTIIPIYFLSELARKKVKFVLSGEGADEVFGGYEQYKIMNLTSKYLSKLPLFMRSKLIPGIYKMLPGSISNRFFKYATSLGKEGQERFFNFLKYYKSDYKDYAKIITIFTEDEKKNLCNFTGNDSLEIMKPHFSINESLFEQMLSCDFNMFLRHLLLKTDKITMSHGLEARVPYLGNDVIDNASRIPSNLKLKGINEKFILKSALYSLLPKEVIKRKKQRFFVPIDFWFKNILRDSVSDIFREKETLKRGYFKQEYIDKIIQKYNHSPLYYGRQLWNLICFELWARVYIDQDKIEKPEINIHKLIN